MAFSGGVFSLYTPGNPVVTGTVITSTWANNTLSDIATGLSTTVLKDGTQTLTANIPMAGYKLTGLGAGSASTNSAQFGQLAEVLLHSTSATLVSAMPVYVTGLFSSAYGAYRVRVTMRPVTNTTMLYVRVSQDGGATYDSSDQAYNYTVGATGTASGSGILIIPTIANSTVYGNQFADLYFNDMASSTTYKAMIYKSVGETPANRLQYYEGGGQYSPNTNPIDAVQFVSTSATIASCAVAVYGIRLA